MEFSLLVKNRHSVRAYRPDPVPRDQIEACLEAARLAPSACNAQPWSFVVVDDPALKERVASETLLAFTKMNRWAPQAPVIIAVVAERPNWSSQAGGVLKNKPFWLVDIGIATEHLCLQAADLGLGTCMLGWFDEAKVKSLLGIPRQKRVPLLVTLGYPSGDEIPAKKRKASKGIVSYNSYG
jgi:nitroreductase